MTVKPGEEFKLRATPSQALMRRLTYLATQDGGSVLTGGQTSGKMAGAADRKGDADGRFIDALQLMTADQQRQLQMQQLSERLDELDRKSLKRLREAEQRLAEIRRNANRTRDGRLVFRDSQGKYRGEDGKEISPDKIDPQKWDSDAPSWEEHRRALREQRDARQFRKEVKRHKGSLDRGDLKKEDLDDLEKRIGKLEAAMPGRSSAKPRSTSAARDYTDKPALGGDAALRTPFADAVIKPAVAPAVEPGAPGQPVAPPVQR